MSQVATTHDVLKRMHGGRKTKFNKFVMSARNGTAFLLA